MMSAEENQRFTQVGPGTPMGELLRRYWHPIAAISELKHSRVKPVRLLGEDLVLYRAKNNEFGLIDRQCPHRRADLSYGIVEECGLRCSYHGWMFDHNGKCLEQPYEDVARPAAKFKDKTEIKAYPVQTLAGMVFAYLGPLPAPLLPNWEPFNWKNGFQQIVFADIPCNWFQCQENSCDPVHFEWMHRNWASRLSNDEAKYGPKHLELKFEEFEFGHLYMRIREDTDQSSEHWTIGTASLFPNAFFLGDHIEWRVPVDDYNTLSVTWAFSPTPKENHPFVQDEIPSWKGPIKDPETGKWITSHVMNQDIVAWVGQGVIADRTKEHLGASDKGITMMRKVFRENLKLVEAGDGDPKGVVRDPERNKCIDLPIKNRDLYDSAMTSDEIVLKAQQLSYHFLTPSYQFQAGMPKDIERAYRIATGQEHAPPSH
ncbi:MAG: aromatic ring-hydroxylating dioxygenase subunit alpha [Henriciella sp.]